jgi:hypothetical protein
MASQAIFTHALDADWVHRCWQAESIGATTVKVEPRDANLAEFCPASVTAGKRRVQIETTDVDQTAAHNFRFISEAVFYGIRWFVIDKRGWVMRAIDDTRLFFDDGERAVKVLEQDGGLKWRFVTESPAMYINPIQRTVLKRTEALLDAHFKLKSLRVDGEEANDDDE